MLRYSSILITLLIYSIHSTTSDKTNAGSEKAGHPDNCKTDGPLHGIASFLARILFGKSSRRPIQPAIEYAPVPWTPGQDYTPRSTTSIPENVHENYVYSYEWMDKFLNAASVDRYDGTGNLESSSNHEVVPGESNHGIDSYVKPSRGKETIENLNDYFILPNQKEGTHNGGFVNSNNNQNLKSIWSPEDDVRDVKNKNAMHEKKKELSRHKDIYVVTKRRRRSLMRSKRSYIGKYDISSDYFVLNITRPYQLSSNPKYPQPTSQNSENVQPHPYKISYTVITSRKSNADN